MKYTFHNIFIETCSNSLQADTGTCKASNKNMDSVRDDLPSGSALYIKEGRVKSKDTEFIRYSITSLQVDLQLTSQF